MTSNVGYASRSLVPAIFGAGKATAVEPSNPVAGRDPPALSENVHTNQVLAVREPSLQHPSGRPAHGSRWSDARLVLLFDLVPAQDLAYSRSSAARLSACQRPDRRGPVIVARAAVVIASAPSSWHNRRFPTPQLQLRLPQCARESAGIFVVAFERVSRYWNRLRGIVRLY